ncbi:MAG TPA: hypothetical protein VFG62_21665 [Rhodopila sp.]|jgi:hypothetical protein|nr:hypothetical protein [Rhodopila sp.]
MIWVGGAVLAALLYAIGPDRFLDACLNLFDTIDAAFRHLAFILGAQAFSVIRALAIAFYLVFAVLSVLSSQRGTGGFGGLVVMTFIAALLVWRPYSTDPAPISHWLVTLALVLVGAATMTQRLVGPARRPVPPPPPFPPGRAP